MYTEIVQGHLPRTFIQLLYLSSRDKKHKGKRKKGGGGGTLSFNMDDDDEEEDENDEEDDCKSYNVNLQASLLLAITHVLILANFVAELLKCHVSLVAPPPVVKKKKLGKNPTVDTSFLPDRDREVRSNKIYVFTLLYYLLFFSSELYTYPMYRMSFIHVYKYPMGRI